MKKSGRCWFVVALLLALLNVGVVSAAPPRQEVDVEYLQRATVQIMQVYTNPVGQTVMSCIGSGTIVSADGLILTNAHVVLPLTGCRADRLAIAFTKSIDKAPQVTFYAEVVVQHIGWDLAVLQITQSIDGRPVDRAALALPFVELGNSNDVRLDDTIEVVGYAAEENEGNNIARAIRGTVSGFTAESRVGDRAWIKTRAALPGSMTGGGAYNDQGRLIGIPTVEPASRAGSGEDCQRVQDSNGDGRVDEDDLCIPASGLINALRPSELARGLILAARIGIQPSSQQDQGDPGVAAANPNARFTRLFFASGVDLAGMPTTVVTSAPSGITRLYLFFDYENMVDGTIYELRVTRGGVIDPTFSLAPATWSGGARGLWYIGSTAQVWPNGEYEFILFIEGVRSASARITIGGPASAEPQFSNILFGVLNLDNQLVSTGNILPVSSTINAEFVYNNMQDGAPWRQVWYYEELKISENAAAWDGGANGKKSVSAASPPEQPLQPGRYRLELYVGERLAATSDFIMAGGQVAYDVEVFTNLTFASELQDGRPGGTVGATFPNTIADLYAIFDWRDVATGTPVTWRWTVDDNPLFEVTQPWSNAPTGAGAWLRLASTGSVADGTYRLELLIGGAVKASASARVGLGQLPITIFAQQEGVQLTGRITDAETGAGIEGASVIVLKPLYDVVDFTWQLTEVFDLAYTDTSGRFALTRLLPRAEFYSVIVIAGGYLPMSTDSLEIAETTRSPLELRLELNRD